MALNNFKGNQLIPLSFKGSTLTTARVCRDLGITSRECQVNLFSYLEVDKWPKLQDVKELYSFFVFCAVGNSGNTSELPVPFLNANFHSKSVFDNGRRLAYIFTTFDNVLIDRSQSEIGTLEFGNYRCTVVYHAELVQFANLFKMFDSVLMHNGPAMNL